MLLSYASTPHYLSLAFPLRNRYSSPCTDFYYRVDFGNFIFPIVSLFIYFRASINTASLYLQTLCTPVSSLPGRCTLRSTARGLLVVPIIRSATAQSRSFPIMYPSI